MIAGIFYRYQIPLNLHLPPRPRHRPSFRPSVKASSYLQQQVHILFSLSYTYLIWLLLNFVGWMIYDFKGDYKGPKSKREVIADWVTSNDDVVRSLPVYVGGFSLLSVLVNRIFSGIALVADASR